MRLTSTCANGATKSWTAKTVRGFSKKQYKEQEKFYRENGEELLANATARKLKRYYTS